MQSYQSRIRYKDEALVEILVRSSKCTYQVNFSPEQMEGEIVGPGMKETFTEINEEIDWEDEAILKVILFENGVELE